MTNIDEGTVLGGRYEITGRVMTSAQRDQVLTGLDQVLNREVLILVAARDNASQAAQSARQLATGERSSSIQILDLGLSDNRTYLVAPGNADVEDFLALLTNQDVYVEPFFTEHLGTELFGETRQTTPQTYEDDAEYYAGLQDDLAEEPDAQQRPEFLNKLSDRFDNWLQEDEDRTRVVPGQSAAAAGTAAAAISASKSAQSEPAVPPAPAPEESEEPVEEQPSVEQPTDEQPTQVVAPVTEDIPSVTDDVDPTTNEQEQATVIYPPVEKLPPPSEEPEEAPRPKAPLIPPPIPQDPEELSADDGYAIEYTDEKQRSTAGRWIAGILLAGVLIAAVVFGFNVLGSTDHDTDEPPVATEPGTDTPAEEEPSDEEASAEPPAGPTPVAASVARVVPDSPELSGEFDADLPTIVDGNQATAWHTYTFTTPQFGGLASSLALVVELEEQAPVSEITLTQNQGSGGAFTVAVSNDPDPSGGVVLTEGSFTGPEYTVNAHDDNGDPIEARYVIINFTELPTLSNTNSADRPYGLRIAEIELN